MHRCLIGFFGILLDMCSWLDAGRTFVNNSCVKAGRRVSECTLLALQYMVDVLQIEAAPESRQEYFYFSINGTSVGLVPGLAKKWIYVSTANLN